MYFQDSVLTVKLYCVKWLSSISKPISLLKNHLNLWKRWEPSGNFQPNFFTQHIKECMKSSPVSNRHGHTWITAVLARRFWMDVFFSWIVVGYLAVFSQVWTAWNQMNWGSVPAIHIGTCCMDMSMMGVLTVSHTWGQYQHGMDLEPWGICDNFWPLKYLKSLKNVMLVESNEIFSNWMHSLLGSDLQSTDCIKSSVLLTLLPGEVSNFRSWNRRRDGVEKKDT